MSQSASRRFVITKRKQRKEKHVLRRKVHYLDVNNAKKGANNNNGEEYDVKGVYAVSVPVEVGLSLALHS